MKKIYVITRHHISNYGSLLQSFATQTVIAEMGYDVRIIDYVRHDEDYHNITEVLLKKNPKWNRNAITRCIYRIFQKPEYIMSGKRFREMQKEYLQLTEKVSKKDELTRITADADILLTGSDQVWGPIGGDQYDSNYFLDFAGSAVKKVSYAASFGNSELSETIRPHITSLLSDYSQITVREKSAVDILTSLGLDRVRQVLDPTLLLNKSEWGKLIPNIQRKPFVLIYQLHKNDEMDRYAKQFAKKVGLPLIRVTATPHQMIRSGKTVLLPKLGDFLWYVKNAEYMITDSFHGTAFAINFGTQFINVLSSGHRSTDASSNIVRTKTRNKSILELTGLSDRILSSFDDFSMIERKIDYTRVNSILSRSRTESIAELRRLLEDRL